MVECRTLAQVMISRFVDFEPHIRLCANSSETGVCFRFYVCFSLCPSPAHALSLSLKNKMLKKIKKERPRGEKLSRILREEGPLGGSVGYASDFISGHDLRVCEFKPHIGLCAVFRSSAPLSLCPSPAYILSKINKTFKKNPKGKRNSCGYGKCVSRGKSIERLTDRSKRCRQG